MKIHQDDNKICIKGEISSETLSGLSLKLLENRNFEILDMKEITPDFSIVKSGILGITDTKLKNRTKQDLLLEAYSDFNTGIKHVIKVLNFSSLLDLQMPLIGYLDDTTVSNLCDTLKSNLLLETLHFNSLQYNNDSKNYPTRIQLLEDLQLYNPVLNINFKDFVSVKRRIERSYQKFKGLKELKEENPQNKEIQIRFNKNNFSKSFI